MAANVEAGVTKAMEGMRLGPGAGSKMSGGGAPTQSKACSLGGAALDLESIREDNRKELLELLDGVSGRKALVLEPLLSGRLNHVLTEGASALKANGVAYFRELRPELGPFEGEAPEHVVYLVRTSTAAMRTIADHVKAALRRGEIGEASIDKPKAPKFHVFMMPRTTLLCKQILEDELVLPYVSVAAYHLDFVCLDRDVLSLECDHCFVDWKVRGDPTTLEFCLQSLLRLEQFFGAPREVKALGPSAKRVAKTYALGNWKLEMARLRERGCYADTLPHIFGSKPPPYEFENYVDTFAKCEVDALVLLDREVDLVTPLVTPLTYEGLIDEIMGGVRNGCVKLDPDVLGDVDDKDKKPPTEKSDDERRKTTKKDDKVAYALNGNDALYAEVRDLNVEKLGGHLGAKAKAIRGSYDEFRANKDASITEIHDFVKRIPGLTSTYKSLQTHINVTEIVKKTTDSHEFRGRWNLERSMLEGDAVYDEIEERIAMQEPPMSTLRLLCLQSVAGGGIKGQAKYDFLRREVLQTYGFELIGTLHNLEKAGLLAKAKETVAANLSLLGGIDAGGGAFGALRKALKLIVDDVDPHDPRDIAYVSSGYAPLSCRLVEVLAKQGFPGLVNALPHLPGAPPLDYAPRDFTRTGLKEAFDDANVGPKLGANPNKLHRPPPRDPATGAKPLMVVFFVGGVTYAEIAALRFLGARDDFPYKIIIATTNICNGNTMIKSLVYEIENKLVRDGTPVSPEVFAGTTGL